MKECFESQDIGKLQEVIRSMPESEARLHMKRCVDSGLWVPSKDDEKTSPEDGFIRRDVGEVRGPFLTSPLGANFDPQGLSCPPQG
jgi:hypothetical protein